MIVFSDLHLREQSEEVCFQVLDYILKLARDYGRHIVFCGDFWHIRYQLSVRLLVRVYEWLERVQREGISIDFVPGNHDQVDTDGTNALHVFSSFENVSVWTEPGILGGEGLDPDLGFVPYRKDREEQIEALMAVAAERPRYIFAHCSVTGAITNNGRKEPDGIPVHAFQASQFILGHYHKHHAVVPHVQYVGSPYQTNFGEAGNVCGCLVIDGYDIGFHEIEIGAPRHFVLEWDPAVSELPPDRPRVALAHDHVRLDVKASQEMIVQGKFKSVLKRQGLDSAQVNVIPTAVNRELKIELSGGETLIEAAARFAKERLGASDQVVSAGLGDRIDPVGSVMDALRRWANA